MNDELHHLLDGELPDEATVGLLRSLLEDGEKRSLFREQMKLQGALFRNENFSPMSSGEEAEMLSRVSSAIGVPAGAPLARRFGPAMLGIVAALFLIGAGLGFFTDRLIGRPGDSPPVVQQPIPMAVPPPAVATPPPCNCDSVAAAVRDSLSRTATTVVPAARKSLAHGARRNSDDDPTGRKAALKLAKKKGTKSPVE